MNKQTEQALLALANRCAGLNPKVAEIGAGMILTLQYEGERALKLHAASQTDPTHGGGANKPAPANAGRPWSQEEDGRLGHAYDTGHSIEKLSDAHQRSRWAIEARLARLGKIPEPPSRFPARHQ